MEKNEMPSYCFIRDPRSLQSASIPKNTRYIDRDTFYEFAEIASGILEAIKELPDRSAFRKLMDMNEEFVSILTKSKGGLS